MPVIVQLPTPLQRYANDQEEVSVVASTVGDALRKLVESSPELGAHLFDANGKTRSFVAVYLGDEDTRHLNGNETPLSDGDTLTIVPSIAGGACLVADSFV